MKKLILKTLKAVLAAVVLLSANPAAAQFNASKMLSGAKKAAKALTLSDKQMAEYVKASVEQLDKQNTVLPASNAYSKRLAKLVSGITEADGIPLNFKVYQTTDVNAFACPDGSVRVYTGIMDLMNDDELIGIIGHEIGHVLKHHSKNAMKQQLLTGAMKDAVASSGGMAATLTESQLGTLGESLISAKYSQKQESEADECGYDFLVKNGRNPWNMVMAFEKMQALENSSGQKANAIQKMFSSHPDTSKRIEKMTKRCEKEGYTRPEPQAATSTTAKKTTRAVRNNALLVLNIEIPHRFG